MSTQLQNLLLLDELYTLDSLGIEYVDPITIHHGIDEELPDNMAELENIVKNCHLCDLNKSRRQSMFGYGNPHSKIVFVDLSVSSANDETNSYYSAKSGEILENMIQNVLKVSIDDVYYTTALKCKGENSNLESYFESCKAYLFKQIELIGPKVVVTLGEDAYRLFSGDNSHLDDVRGHSIKFEKYDLVPIYHPSYLLRNPSKKRETMYDLNTIKGYL